MIPDKDPREDFLWFGVRWTSGVRKLVFWAVVAACGGGLGMLLNQIPQWVSMAPVWAFVALLGVACITVHSPALAAASPPDDKAFFLVETDYGRVGGFFQ